jgi:chromosome segregation ATPase
LREHASKVTSLTSLLQHRETAHADAQTPLESLSSARDEHVRALQQLEQAVSLVTNHAARAENTLEPRAETASPSLKQSRSVVELHQEIESRAHDAEGAIARAADLENAWARSREGVDQSRALATGSLGKLLDSHSEMRANAGCGPNGQSDKITAVEEEASNLQLLLKESEKQSSTHQNGLQAQRRRMRDLTAEQASLHSRLSGLQAPLTEQISASGQLHQDLIERLACAMPRGPHQTLSFG